MGTHFNLTVTALQASQNADLPEGLNPPVMASAEIQTGRLNLGRAGIGSLGIASVLHRRRLLVSLRESCCLLLLHLA
jgi:hypothetical protein